MGRAARRSRSVEERDTIAHREQFPRQGFLQRVVQSRLRFGSDRTNPCLDFTIPDAEFETLNRLDRNQRYNFPFRWGLDLFGELGAEEAERRAEEFAAKQRASA